MATAFGDVTRSGATFTLDFERVLATTVDDAWSAVTELERLRRWMAHYEGELRLGGTWRALSSDGSVFTTGTVLECTPPHRFVTTWHAVEENETRLIVTVEEHPEGALLRLRHEDLGSIFYGAGWQTYLEQLDDELGAAPSSIVDPERAPGVDWDERFTALREPWAVRLGVVDEG